MSISEYAVFMKHSNNTKMNTENILTYIFNSNGHFFSHKATGTNVWLHMKR